MHLIVQCVRFREMLMAFTRRELRQRYVGSVLGRAWPLLQPLLMLAVYYVVFINLFDLKLPSEFAQRIAQALGQEGVGQLWNVLLLCAGLLPWLMTAEFVVRATGVVVDNGGLVKKVRFPSELLPISLLASYLFNLLLLSAIFAGVIWAFTPFRTEIWWMFFPTLILQGVFLLGLAYMLATVNVFIRDTAQLVPLVVNVWFFLTPIVYLREQLVGPDHKPKPLAMMFDWNPMAYFVDLYRWALVVPESIRLTYGPDGKEHFITMGEIWRHLGIVAVVSFAFLLVGYKIFMANKYKFADEI
ncbi:MAG TPA: hypothetical protein ENK43_03820 [Planctomycetes bacterium]|nr:hypothetical protein [Planctomycetota bacterium]